MAFADAVQGYWLWAVFAVIALVVVVGYFRVRGRLKKVERAGDAADAARRAEGRAHHAKDKHKGVE
ncbi:MAG TPA: hypothetical protein VNW46_18725 [Gemmatimonadaceae bacterium]|jgi:hypothetical protein|nr:hypothetical protein [Gemmatimonadaceae bacterium]